MLALVFLPKVAFEKAQEGQKKSSKEKSAKMMRRTAEAKSRKFKTCVFRRYPVMLGQLGG